MNSSEILDKLVSFPTVSGSSNLDLLSFITGLCDSHNIAYDYVGESGLDRQNLFLRIGPDSGSGILLSGHSDVVPANKSAWSSDPFVLRESDGKLYGRGTTDMKGFVSCCLNMFLRASSTKLSCPLYLAISYDEEIGCLGVRSLLDWIPTQDLDISHCLVGEPTLMNLGIGHKGKVALRVHFKGVGGHSSIAPHCLNSITMATDFIKSIETLQLQIKESYTHDSGYSVPYSTLHVGRIRGGESLNVVPDYSYIDLEFRHLPSDDPSAVIDILRSSALSLSSSTGFSDASIDIESLVSYPSFEASTDTDYFGSLLSSPDILKVPYGTEAGLFSSALGVDTIICGPGSMDQGHISDEYIESSQLSSCDELLNNLLLRICV